MTISIGVQGASGGLGASSLVAAIGLRAARAGRNVVCVDHRCTAGGLDVVLGVEQEPGLRWPDLHRARGHLDGDELFAALPGRGALRVLSADRRRPRAVPLAALSAVRGGLDGAVDLLVHDLPGPDTSAWPVVAQGHDLVVVLAGGQAHRVAAATSLALLLDEIQARHRTLVARTASADEAAALAELVGLPLAGVLPTDRTVTGCLARASAPGSARGPLQDVADDLLACCLVPAGQA